MDIIEVEVVTVENAKEILIELIDEITPNETNEVIDFINYLKQKREKELYSGLNKLSESSTEFWDNSIDDEVWNNV